MAIRLGELLINEKMITKEQLEEGLKNQVIYGIRLGSSLVEMGCVDDMELAKLLSRKLAVPFVTRKELAAVFPDVINTFPRDLASRYRVIPFRVDGNKLMLAMSDPSDLKAVEEIGFITGKIVIPHIAPDVLISKALAKYYKISSGDMRYQMVAEKHRKKEEQPQAVQQTITMQGYSDSGELLQMTIPAEFEGFGSDDDDASFGTYPENAVVRYTIDRLSTDFADARTRDDVANVFITYLGQEFATGSLFIVRNNAANGWLGVTGGEKIERFSEISIMLSKPSVLRDVVESKNFAIGSLVATPENRGILTQLKIRFDTPLLAIPIIMLDKVVAVVIVSADMEALSKKLTELQKLVRKASLAFEMLIIRNKILLT